MSGVYSKARERIAAMDALAWSIAASATVAEADTERCWSVRGDTRNGTRKGARRSRKGTTIPTVNRRTRGTGYGEG